MTELYIGLMSGTSIDGVDAVLVDFSKSIPLVKATDYQPYSLPFREKILALCQPGENEIERMGELDTLLGKTFARVVNSLLEKQSLSASAIKAIGSHGQTIRHHPNATHPFTLQIGDPNIIAAETGITTVADFRRKDIAIGGQGAPLVPAFHQSIFTSKTLDRAIVNIGGIANVTLLPANKVTPIIGFDTGPGNVLLDAWSHLHQNNPIDHQGQWAAQGQLHRELLSKLLTDSYFALMPPKSTGREYFHLAWLKQYLSTLTTNITPVDVQTTLVELTAKNILDAIQQNFSQGEIFICGGGARNKFLMSRIEALASGRFAINTTAACGVDPDWVEAIAFAWFARQTINTRSGNLPSVTGARQHAVLGGVYYHVDFHTETDHSR